MNRVARAIAPAGVGNVSVGFDILGHSLEGAGDIATVRRIDEPLVRIVAVRGVATGIPLDAARNTAGRSLLALRELLGLAHGFEIELDKGIALGSGMGGSAASAVAALVAANALLDAPLAREALYPFALEGESAASGSRHGDNVGPMLLGGLVLATHERLVPIPVPPALRCALVHPHIVVETRRARDALAGHYQLGEFVAQSSHLAQLLAGCYGNDLELILHGLSDVLVEPRRAALIPGFAAVKRAALEAGALGASISGAGPSVFAWCVDDASAGLATRAMQAAFAAVALEADALVSPVAGPAAELLP